MDCGVIILAAGRGKRMCSSLPKVLHEICGKPLLFHILDQVRTANANVPIGLVLGHGREKIEARLSLEDHPNISIIVQEEQKGTGHAVRCALESDWGKGRAHSSFLVLPGDLPLVPAESIRQMMAPLDFQDALRLLTCRLEDPTGYGRVIRRPSDGRVVRIVEQKDASPEELSIHEVATSIYLFRGEFLERSLSRISDDNAQNEYYLTDLIEIASDSEAQEIRVLEWENPEDLRGVNDPLELSRAERFMAKRLGIGV